MSKAPDNNSMMQSLHAGQVHLYICDPAVFVDVAHLEQMRALLSDAEQQRLAAFKFDQDSHSFLVSHAMLRNALSNYADIAPGDWAFIVNEHNKPYVAADLPRLEFNLTHTDGLCAIVITAGARCGVDVENVRRQNNIEAVAQKMFTGQELAFMSAEQASLRDRFFSLWTLRESFVKATGTGLAGNSAGFHFELDEACNVADIRFTADMDGSDTDWRFELSRPTDDHVLAVCVEPVAASEIVVIENVQLPP